VNPNRQSSSDTLFLIVGQTMGKKVREMQALTKNPSKENSGKKRQGDAGLEKENQKQLKEEKQQKRNKKKKNYEKISSTSEDIEFNHFLRTEFQLSIIIMSGDGNCFFRSIAHQLSNFSNDLQHMKLRHDIVAYMKKRKDYFVLFLDEDEEDFESYVAEMNSFGCWGGHLELYAAAQCFQLSIHVFQWNAPKYVIQCDEENNPEGNPLRIVQLSYHGGCHYNSVVPLSFLSSSSSTAGASTAVDADSTPSLYVPVNKPANSSKLVMIDTIEQAVPWVKREEIELALEWTENHLENTIDLLCTNLEGIQLALKSDPEKSNKNKNKKNDTGDQEKTDEKKKEVPQKELNKDTRNQSTEKELENTQETASKNNSKKEVNSRKVLSKKVSSLSVSL
jgi:flagellum-specific peptidoglycan hydrolase FlgJ